MDGNRGAERMSNGSRPETLLQQFEDLFTAGVVGGLSDGELLERFLLERSPAGEAAFRALVERHGPMVLRVCNRTLNDRDAAEDAFQATFLVLARQACSIRKRHSVACWLFGVARRAATRIQVAEARRRRYERQSTPRLAVLAARQSEASESFPELHAEVERLPEKYRIPIVLCHFEGLTQEQAASRLHWPVGTVKTRLSRGREQLRSRLQRRGWPSVPMALASRHLPGNATVIPRRLLSSTLEMATRFTAGTAAGGFVSPAALTITSGVLRAMWINKLRLAGMVLFGVLGLGLGAAVVAQQAAGNRPAGVVEQSDPPGARVPASTGVRFAGVTGPNQEKVVRIRPRFDGRVDKVLVSVGSRVKKGDPLLELFSSELAAAKNDYETARNLHDRDKKALDSMASLNYAVPKKSLNEAQVNEANSKLQMKVAKDNLLVFGLTEKEIDDVSNEPAVQKERMILHSPVDGMVVNRVAHLGEVVKANDSLLVIGLDDPLWVTASVGERDSTRLEIGQRLIVEFPFDGQTVNTTVEAIGTVVDPNTQTVNVRTSIPNPDHQLKYGMFVQVQLQTPTRPSGSGMPQPPGEARSNPSVTERLNHLERTIDKLLKEKEERSSNVRVFERLDQLERKLNQLLDDRKDN